MVNRKLTVVAVLVFSFSSLFLFAQKVTVQSPNQKIRIELFSEQNMHAGEWYLKAYYINNGKVSEAIPRIGLGLSRSDQDFSKELKFLKAGKQLLVNERYTTLHGKKSVCTNSANEVIVSFENPSKAKLNVIIRAYQYMLIDKSGSVDVRLLRRGGFAASLKPVE